MTLATSPKHAIMSVRLPTRFLAKVLQFRSVIQARVQNDGEYSDPFPVTNCVKQGGVMVPTRFQIVIRNIPGSVTIKEFNMRLSGMLTYAFQGGDAGFPFRYRFDGKPYSIR